MEHDRIARHRRRHTGARDRHLRLDPLGESRRARLGGGPARGGAPRAVQRAPGRPAAEGRVRRQPLAAPARRARRGAGRQRSGSTSRCRCATWPRASPCCAAGTCTQNAPAARSSRQPIEQFRRHNRDLYVPAGDVNFWQAAIRDADDPLYGPLKAAIAGNTAISVDLLYGDHEGGQRTITRFLLTPREQVTDDEPWLGSARSCATGTSTARTRGDGRPATERLAPAVHRRPDR